MKIYYATLLFLLTFSCTNEDKIPNDVLPKDKMIDILIDVHLTESAISLKNLPKDSALFLYRIYEKDILKKHHTSAIQYEKSTDYYIEHVKLMDKIYEAVVDSLSLREAQKKLY